MVVNGSLVDLRPGKKKRKGRGPFHQPVTLTHFLFVLSGLLLLKYILRSRIPCSSCNSIQCFALPYLGIYLCLVSCLVLLFSASIFYSSLPSDSRTSTLVHSQPQHISSSPCLQLLHQIHLPLSKPRTTQHAFLRRRSSPERRPRCASLRQGRRHMLLLRYLQARHSL